MPVLTLVDMLIPARNQSTREHDPVFYDPSLVQAMLGNRDSIQLLAVTVRHVDEISAVLLKGISRHRCSGHSTATPPCIAIFATAAVSLNVTTLFLQEELAALYGHSALRHMGGCALQGMLWKCSSRCKWWLRPA